LSYCIEYYGSSAGPTTPADCREQLGTFAQGVTCPEALAVCNAVVHQNGVAFYYYAEKQLSEARAACRSPQEWRGP
jgi:hypothetical protein